MVGERVGLGAAKQGWAEERERLGGWGKPAAGTGTSELEPEINMCMYLASHLRAPAHSYWLAAPLPIQAVKNPIMPR